ncbi:MAG: hypothetical protein PSV35_03895 [bacterium]|nr:hypothetical protein [bacterium]
MQTLYQILGILGAVMIIFVLYRTIKGRPDQFSKENLNKSFLTMGVLAIGLIGFIALLILMLRHS